jgi:hypothetical protein
MPTWFENTQPTRQCVLARSKFQTNVYTGERSHTSCTWALSAHARYTTLIANAQMHVLTYFGEDLLLASEQRKSCLHGGSRTCAWDCCAQICQKNTAVQQLHGTAPHAYERLWWLVNLRAFDQPVTRLRVWSNQNLRSLPLGLEGIIRQTNKQTNTQTR